MNFELLKMKETFFIFKFIFEIITFEVLWPKRVKVRSHTATAISKAILLKMGT